MDLTSRLRAIVHSGPPKSGQDRREGQPAIRELTYEPDNGAGYEASLNLDRVGAILGGRPAETPFGRCLVIDRRYEADRLHGTIRIGECELDDASGLGILDPSLPCSERPAFVTSRPPSRTPPRTIFIDLETTGLSGGAGTVAFLVGCGYFDLGAFQVRQFLLTSLGSERALLAAVAEFFDGADLIVTYNGKTFDVPVMETRWLFHRLRMPLDAVPHFDMLHSARRLWKSRTDGDAGGSADGSGCRLTTLERTLFNVTRVGDVAGFEIPGRFFKFLRNGDPRPLEPVLEHNRLDLVSLAAVMARAVHLTREGHPACRDSAEALALGRVYERADAFARAEACYERATAARNAEIRGEALYRLGIRHRRERRFEAAAAIWQQVMELTEPHAVRRKRPLDELRQFAAEALAIHREHRDRDFSGAREVALFALKEGAGRREDGLRHRLARLDRKISRSAASAAKKIDAQLFSS